MRGIGFNSKAFQVPSSQTRLYLMGTRHEFCPLGLKHDVSRAIRMEVKANAIAGKLNRSNAESLDTQNMHIKQQGLKESRLTNPTNIKTLSMAKYSQNIKTTMAIEIVNKKYPFYSHYLKQANTSGTLKMCCGDNTHLIYARINVSQNEEKSAAWMSKMRANAGYLHKSETHTLKASSIRTNKFELNGWTGSMRTLLGNTRQSPSVNSSDTLSMKQATKSFMQ
jgi:site-specific DNA-cytosine methylase